ncbi:acyl carrier protein [Paraburkholderia sp. Cpub6]|uniref:acyl carrier protein n=1 Tax=Paraburkholderia sp. Cpub6 TaxID=2723094 RepID=UPI001614548C|nr:acyl carrier protein [Paraburkholderia sp. Cpub6]MBB5461055.1 acyl carrier protein [Paraburkholderia sp. Cpub6]
MTQLQAEPRTTHVTGAQNRLLDVIRSLSLELHGAPQDQEPSAPAATGTPVFVPVTLETQFERDLGFDSLARAELLARIERPFGVQLPIDAFALARTPADILVALANAPARAASSATARLRERVRASILERGGEPDAAGHLSSSVRSRLPASAITDET